MSIASNLNLIKSTIPPTVTLVAVSKTKPNSDILEAYNAGERIFGENKVQELVEKEETLPKDINWHMIGHLQSNKVKYIAPFIALIHAVDNIKLLKEINKQALKHNRIINCLLQFHIANEDSKFGLTYSEAIDLLKSDTYKELKNIKISGVMGMATFTSDESQIVSEFKSLKNIFDSLNSDFFSQDESFKEISMGMSGDYQIAIKEGSTMIRVGSNIFGNR